MDRLTDLWRVRSRSPCRVCRTAWKRSVGCLRTSWEKLIAPDDTRMLNAKWHGTGAELCRLRASLERNWPSALMTCVYVGGLKHMVLLDQDLADHLLYVYRSRERFVQQEFTAELLDLRP